MKEYSMCSESNDREYTSYVESELESDESIKLNCFYIIGKYAVDMYLNINSNGKAVNIHSFPKEADTSCAVNFLREIQFTPPISSFCGRFMI